MITYIKLNIRNKSDGKIINSDFFVCNNDKTIDIKEKIFAYYKDSTTFWTPEYVTLTSPSFSDANNTIEQVDENESDFTLDSESNEDNNESNFFLSKNSLNIFQKKDIYADNLLNNLRNIDFISIYSDESKFNEKYIFYKNIYPDLTEISFSNAFKILLYQLDKIKYKELFDDVKKIALEIIDRQKILINKWNKIDSVLSPFLEYEEKIYIDENQMTKILSLEMIFTNKASSNNLVNIFNIFNNVTLSSKYIAIITNGSFLKKKEPISKIYEKLPKTLTKNDIKNWILNEKKKDNVISYKKIKGAVFKIIHNNILFNLKINASGNVFISYDNDSRINMYLDLSYSVIINYINEIYLEFINYLKTFDNVYNSNINLSDTEYSASILSLFGDFETSERIQKNAFSEFCLQKTISENLFALKDVKSTDSISLFYKKNIQDDTKGITINIRDNPYVLNSSTITILGCKNIVHASIILKYIELINYYNIKIKNQELDDTQKIKKKSTIKDLKKQGVDTISTNCQKPRQPIVALDSEAVPLKNSYSLNWKNQKYICPKEEFKYPGFTNKNIVCCFTKDQRRTPKYIKNLKSEELEIIVQASNYPIDIIDNNIKKTTLLIKLISAPEETNSKSPYYYLDFIEKDRLGIKPIIQNDLITNIQNLELENSIWLEPVSLSQIITTAPKNKCNNTPNLTKGNIDGNINNLCQNHNVHKFFGFNQNSYPCCFDKSRDIIHKSKIKEKDEEILKQHILNNDKILDINRIGILPDFLESIFHNEVDVNFYRLGVIQNKESILNCILISLDKTFNSQIFNNTLDLKNLLAEKFSEKKLFYKIYNGNMQELWDSEKDFLKDFISDNTYIDYKIILEIVFHILSLNVLILDVDEENSENSKIICSNIVFDKKYKTVILLKRNIDSINKTPQFEIVISLNDNIITKIFDGDFKLVILLKNFIEKSCVVKENFPDDYPFENFLKINHFESIDILYQITNSFNKVNWIILKNIPGLILPVEETFILDNVLIEKFENIKQFFSVTENIDYIKKLNKLYKLNITIRGVVHTKSFVDGILLSYGLFIPCIKIKTNENFIKQINYYPSLDKHIDFKSINNSLENFDKINKNLYNIKKNVAFNINKSNPKSQEVRNFIIQIVSSTKYTNNTKFEMILQKLNKLYNNYDKTFQFYLKIVINEILSDTVKMSIINNNVILNKNSTDKIIQNKNEVLLLNLNDFLQYVK